MKARITTAVLATLVLTLVFSAISAFAAEAPTTFFISALHNVKGDEIGLTREAPVRIAVVKDGLTIAYLPLQYRERVEANLPGGTYELLFNDAETGETLFSCGPYEIKNGDDVRLQAHEQGPGRVPNCFVRFR